MSSPVYLGVFQTSPNSSETCNFHYKVEEPIVYDLEPFPNPLTSFCYAVFAQLEDSFRLSGKFRADGPVGVSMDNVWTPVSHSHIFQSLRLGSPRHSSVTSSTWPRGHALLLAPRSLEAGGCLPPLAPPRRSLLVPLSSRGHCQHLHALAPPPLAPQRPWRRARACACACALGPKSGRAVAGTRRAAGGAANGRRRWLAAVRRGLRGC